MPHEAASKATCVICIADRLGLMILIHRHDLETPDFQFAREIFRRKEYCIDCQELLKKFFQEGGWDCSEE